ncbi:HAMP domain-containing sensor histidine kinase [Bacillus sp. JJ664]
MKLLKGIIQALIFFTGIILTSSIVAYFSTTLIYDRYFDNLSDIAEQTINTFLTFILLGMLAAIVGILFHHPKQRIMINEITNAIKSISRGEYNVSLNFEKFRDVNRGEIKKIIDSFNNMAVSLEQVEKMRQEFISNVSHEIQSPLTSIKGFAKVLQNENLPPEERMQYLSIIEYESNRLSKLSDNLLKLTSLESQDQPLDKALFSLNSQLMYSILSCEPQILEKDINMVVNLNKVDIEGDEVLLNQVWQNLISNSIKFTPNGGEISVSVIDDTDKIIVKIKDSGIGISDEDQIHIFERFYKADKSRDRTTMGNGLGLSIVRKIVEMHNGVVYVESEVGIGSTFIVELPLKQS